LRSEEFGEKWDERMATAGVGLRAVTEGDSSIIRSSWLVGRWKEVDVEGLFMVPGG
jgi:hypothetical protein